MRTIRHVFLCSLAAAVLLWHVPSLKAAYVDQGAVILDQSTGLHWEKGQSAATMSWEQALTHCEARSTGGMSDWRLPNKRELESLVDDTRTGPAIDPLFDAPGSSYFWASTTAVGYTYFNYAWTVVLNTGVSEVQDKTWGGRVRCVRGRSGALPSPAGTSLLLVVPVQ